MACGKGWKKYYESWDTAHLFPQCRKLSEEELALQETGLFEGTASELEEWLGFQELAAGADALYAGKEDLRKEGLAAAEGATAAVEESARMVDPLVRQQAGQAITAAMGGAGGMSSGGAKVATLSGVARQSAMTIADAVGKQKERLAGQKMDEVLYKTQAGSSLEKATQKATDTGVQLAAMREANASGPQMKSYLKGQLANEPKFVYDQKGDKVPNPMWGTVETLAKGIG